jgi:hypothetical protein
MSSIRKFRSSASTNRNQGGGNKLSGLPPSVGGNPFARNVWARKATVPFDKRNVVFCINQLGGIGRKSSMFLSTADGVRCVQPEDDAVVEDNASAENDIIISDDEVSDIEEDSGDCTDAVTTLDTSELGLSSSSGFGRGISITKVMNTDIVSDASYIAVVGRPGEHLSSGLATESGSAVYVYKYNSAGWTLDASDSLGTKIGNLGFSVSSLANFNTSYGFISGCPQYQYSLIYDDVPYSGKVFLYSYSNTLSKWSPATSIYPLQGFKDKYDNPITDSSSALFGYSVALSNSIDSSFAYAIIGEPNRDLSGSIGLSWSEAGAVYLAKFTIDASNNITFTPMCSSTDGCSNLSQITAGGCTHPLTENNASYARFGYSVDIDRGEVDSSFVYGIIGAPGVSGKNAEGQVYTVKIDTSTHTWNLQDKIMTSPSSLKNTLFGYSVAIRTIGVTTYAVVGEPGADPSGAAYLYSRTDSSESWSFDASLNPPNSDDISFGCTVAISDKYAFVGNDGNTNTYIFDLSGQLSTDISSVGYTEMTEDMSASRPYMAAADDQLIVGYPRQEMVKGGTVQVYDLSQCVGKSYCGVGDCCPAGQGIDSDSGFCTDCPAGTYSAAGASICTDCSSSAFSAAGASSCCSINDDDGCNIYIQFVDDTTRQLYMSQSQGKEHDDEHWYPILSSTPNKWLWKKNTLFNAEEYPNKLYYYIHGTGNALRIGPATDPQCDCDKPSGAPCCGWGWKYNDDDNDESTGYIHNTGAKPISDNESYILYDDSHDLCGTQLKAGKYDSDNPDIGLTALWKIIVVSDSDT